MNDYFPHQQEADDAIFAELETNGNPKCIVKMFCGSGKSLIMAKCKIVEDKELVVYTFPTLGLIKQFHDEYLIKMYREKQLLKISSECELESTTDAVKIRNFLQVAEQKIICVTYQSFETLLENLGENRIDIWIGDEAHRSVGQTYQKLIFNNPVCEKQIFFTATPKNANGIIMYDADREEPGDCGNLVYDYSYLNGVNDGYLNPIEIRVDMYTENTNKSIYESIARAVFVSGNNRVLTFHADVYTDRETTVKTFTNEAIFKEAFEKVRKAEFSDNRSYKKIKMVFLSAECNKKQRDSILNALRKTKDNEVMVVCSCKTIGEGIDTNKANMTVFVDPKSSYVDIIQNIGRIVRKQKSISTVLIPCWVDKAKYLECDGDKDKCDEVIRKDMSDGGNFNGILNVLSALKQEDPELYEICLYYPHMYSPQEIVANLNKQGFKVLDPIDDGELVTTLCYLLEDDFECDEECETDEDIIMSVADNYDVCVEVHTQSLETPIEVYNEDKKGKIVRLFRTEDDEGVIYQPVVKKSGNKRKSGGFAKKPENKNRLHLNVHSNDDVKVLWNIKDGVDLTKEICSCVIDCEVVPNTEIWKKRLDEVKKYIDEHEKRPSDKDEAKSVKQLGTWLGTQKKNYDTDITKSKGIMKTPEIHKIWTEFINDPKYSEYFESNETFWKRRLDELKKYIDQHEKRPSNKDKDKSVKQLGEWIGTQVANYDTDINESKCIMKTPEIHKLWTDFIDDPKYSMYFESNESAWKKRLDELKKYIDDKKKRPSQTDKDKSVKQLGIWISHQVKNYDADITKSKEIMKTSEIHALWTEFINDPKYHKYFQKDTPKKSMALTKPSVKKAETSEQRKVRLQSELSQLHKKYKTMNSANLHNEFAADPEQWTKYHEISEENEKSFPEEDIPRNQIIRKLDTYKTKRTKTIVDLGCGKAQIYEHFKDDKRFNIISYDHVSFSENVTKCDIQSTPLEDDSVEICILSLAMWGSNCKTYIKEAHRILESGGMLYIIEPTKRWTDFDEQGKIQSIASNKLHDLLEENGFGVVTKTINKFSLFETIKKMS